MKPSELEALPLVVELETSNRALSIGRTHGYALAKAGEYPVPVLRIGQRYKVLTSDLRKFLGIGDPLTGSAK